MRRRLVKLSDSHAAVSWSAVVSTYLPALVFALGTGIALPSIPALAKSFDVSFGVASGVVTSWLIGNVFGTIPTGWMIDRFGRRAIMIAGPLITAASALGAWQAHSFVELMFWRFFTGWAAQMWLMGRLAAISHNATASERGRLVSWMFGMDNTGKLAGPILGGFIADHWGINAPFIAFAFIALLAVVPTILFAPETPTAEARKAAGGERPKTLTLAQIIMPRLAYFGVAVGAGLTRGPVQADLLHLYAAFAYHLGPAQIGYLATGAALLSWPIGFMAGWMMDRFGRKHTMVPGFGGVAFAMTALAASAWFELSYGWYVVLFYCAIAVQSLTGGSIQTVGADVAPPEARGTFLGLWRFAGQGGATISPIAFAFLSEQVNYASAFMFVAAAAGSVATLLVWKVPETGGRKNAKE